MRSKWKRPGRNMKPVGGCTSTTHTMEEQPSEDMGAKGIQEVDVK